MDINSECEKGKKSKTQKKRKAKKKTREKEDKKTKKKANEHHGFVSSKRKHKDNLNVKD